MSRLGIRRAGAGDVPVLEDIVKRAYGVYIERIGRRPGPMDDDYSSRVTDADVFVAEDSGSGSVCGLIVLEVMPDHVLIANVAVDPARQRTGIGRALLAFAEEFAVEKHLYEVRLFTNVAMTENQRLYLRLGYEEDGRRVSPEFARVYFRKRLNSPSRHRDVA
jgi:ribosomal protein S18 acetylase RimI-like enzyme